MVRSILIHLELSIHLKLWLKDAEAAIVKDGVVQVRVKDAPMEHSEKCLDEEGIQVVLII